ncbi:MAG: carboxylating nicotinate-nucleotide diphosphorylase [Thermoplasmata archaeon]
MAKRSLIELSAAEKHDEKRKKKSLKKKNISSSSSYTFLEPASYFCSCGRKIHPQNLSLPFLPAVPPLAARLISEYLEADIGYGDISGSLFSKCRGEGIIIAKENGVISGVEFALYVFYLLGLQATAYYHSGDEIHKGSTVIKVEGSVPCILAGERTALNILMRMSGIATYTSRLLKTARKKNPNIIVASTRKTTPGFSFFEKRAVRDGGGDTHRLRLDDMAMLKDNHIAAAGSIRKAVALLRKHLSFSRKIEVEAQDKEMAFEAADAGADIVMLDNFTPEETEAAYKTLKARFPAIFVEVSGGINEKNIADYAEHADIISAGSITHSYKSLDLSLEIIGKNLSLKDV